MVKEIIQIGDPKLNQVSEPIKIKDIQSSEVQSTIIDLLDTASQAGLNSVGLSAVQIGVLSRIFTARRIDIEKDGVEQWEIFINPEIEVIDTNPSEMWEGCLSVGKGGNQLFAPVSRQRGVRVSYYNPKGEKLELEAFDYMAHVIQHEVDHLNGVLFLRYVTNPKNIWKSSALDKYLDKHSSYPPIYD